ncbi:MAG TPA: glycine zipper family protein, partial [Myxococcaceae bacterium]|nr:glycine zipper family protein [Myxococcaceae bacterium]
PAKGQDQNQQSQDETQCYAWAKQQTGVDPVTLKADPNTAAAVQKQAQAASAGTAVKSTAGGAAAGAAVGAITGDTGTGAAVGATAGAMRGVAKKAKANKQAAAQGQQAAQQEAQAKFDTFKKAMTACLSGRGYSVQ